MSNSTATNVFLPSGNNNEYLNQTYLLYLNSGLLIIKLIHGFYSAMQSNTQNKDLLIKSDKLKLKLKQLKKPISNYLNKVLFESHPLQKLI